MTTTQHPHEGETMGNTITLDEFIESVKRTAKPPGLATFEEVTRTSQIVSRVWTLGLVGEAGEVCDLLKKHFGHGHPLDRQKLIAELGDVAWYLTAITLVLRGPEGVRRAWSGDELQGNDLVDAALSLISNADLLASDLYHPEYLCDESFDEHADYVAGSIRRLALAAPEPFGMPEMWAVNREKLMRRYPQGFDPARSVAWSFPVAVRARDSAPAWSTFARPSMRPNPGTSANWRVAIA
jgi:hypothetical protein